MYPRLELAEEWARTTKDDRPFIMCEFSHAMGNSNGGLADYWALVEARRGLQGGFIWDWVDQGLAAVDAGGRRYWKYGGDFGDSPSDLDFICNGLVFADRSPKPVLAECAKLFQPLAVEAKHPLTGRIRVRNKRDFTDLSDLELFWSLLVEGETIQSGRIDLPRIGPGESAEIDLGLSRKEDIVRKIATLESFVLVEFRLREASAWAPRGHRLAWEELALGPSWPETRARGAPAFEGGAGEGMVAPSIEEAAGTVTVTVGGSRPYNLRFSAEGLLESLAFAGVERLATPLVMNLWRAPTENDGLKTFMDYRGREDFSFYYEGKVMYEWLEAGLEAPVFDLRERRLDKKLGIVTITQEARGRTGRRLGRFVQTWSFTPSGPVGAFLFDLDPELPELPRIGLACALAPGFERVRWYGRGPHECYSDRKAGAAIGLYEAEVDELGVPYVLPQENGNRTDVRRLELKDLGRGLSLRVSSPGTFDFGASHQGSAQWWEALHTADLVRRPETFLYLDVAQRGLGTATCGPDTGERYRLRPGPRQFVLEFGAGG
jgi:beta-galactosidase